MNAAKYNLEDLNQCSRLRGLVQNADEVFSIEDQPALGALCALRGLVFEFLKPQLDRLSPFFGIEFSEVRDDFKLQVVESSEWGLGLCIERISGRKFEARHPDLVHLLNRESLVEMELKKIVIFPLEVADRIKKLGFKLVIVRDWILQAALHRSGSPVLNYFICNDWELENVISATQARMMCNHELPFFGTHDVVDHLFGLSRQAFRSSHLRAAKVYPALYNLHQNRANAETVDLKIAYVVGVLLDDLAQPKFYNSKKHLEVLKNLNEALLLRDSSLRKDMARFTGIDFENMIGLTRDVNAPLAL
jgi:hypothetical protein